MSEILNIIMALVGHTPWLVIGYIVHLAYNNKSKWISIKYKDFSFESKK